MITDDLIRERSLDASKMIQTISSEINGSGGGQPFFATAGGSKTNGIDKAFDKLEHSIA